MYLRIVYLNGESELDDDYDNISNDDEEDNKDNK